jgi:hypothetical protein
MLNVRGDLFVSGQGSDSPKNQFRAIFYEDDMLPAVQETFNIFGVETRAKKKEK